MTKQDKIQEAYGEHWDKVKEIVSHDGWVGALSLIPYFEVSEIDFINSKQRLLSLRGIENNNGWVKIYCENDIPQFDCDCFALENDGKILLTSWIQKDNVNEDKLQREFWKLNLSHYKIIETTKPPIY
jgi:hypothetical protein